MRLRELFEHIDAALEKPTVLDLHGGAAVAMLGMSDRTTIDIDVLPTSVFEDASLRRACESAGILFEPLGGDLLEREYLEVIPRSTLVLPVASDELPYDDVFRGRRLTVRTPPAADLVIGKLRRLDPTDVADVEFLVGRFALTAEELEESFARLPRRLQRDPVIEDNWRYVWEDLLGRR